MTFLVKKKRKIRNFGVFDQKNNKVKNYRIKFLFIFFLIIAVFIVMRLFKLQIVDNDYYLALASGQHEIFKKLYPERGTIYFYEKGGSLMSEPESYPVAINKQMNLLYAVPTEINDPEAVTEVLKEVFGINDYDGEVKEFEEKLNAETGETIKIRLMTEEEFQKIQEDKAQLEKWQLQLRKENDPYEPLKHFVSDEQKDLINSYNLEGIYFTDEVTRYYSENNLAGQLIGFVGRQAEDNMLVGSYGIEGCYNDILSGEPGFFRSELDTRGRWIAIADKDFREAKNGDDIVLTIDKSIEYYVCDELKKTVEFYEADKGSVIVMNPKTGEVLAMCNFPDFDPNKYNEVDDVGVFNNYAITDSYESGSVFKPITMAAGIDSGAVDAFSSYNDVGELHIDDFTIRNSDLKANGWQSMTQILEKSLNTGTVYVANKVGRERFNDYISNFGFGKKTNIDLCYEPKGDISSLAIKGADIYLATASFGQGITVTPIQLAVAFSALANEGKVMEPYVIKKIIDKQGNIIEEKKPKIVGQAVSPKTAKIVQSMLVSVVKNGHAKNAAVPGYLVGGKTGTAQVPDFERGGYSDQTIHSFAGFAPFDDPVFVAVIKLDNVKKVEFAADSTTGLFAKIAKFVLDYYGIPTTN